MTRKTRAQRYRMAVAHAHRLDDRREAVTGIRASDRRRVLKDLNRERRAIGRALDRIVRSARKLVA